MDLMTMIFIEGLNAVPGVKIFVVPVIKRVSPFNFATIPVPDAENPKESMVPAILGWYVVCRDRFDSKTALKTAAVGGVLFTIVFMFSMFLALTDGSPIALPSWFGPIVAGAVAGAVVGAMLGKSRGAGIGAVWTAGGMAAAVGAMAIANSFAPAATQQPGATKSLWVAGMLLIVGVFAGAAAGGAVHQIKPERDAE